jgi:hypothetical protein
MMLCRDLLDGDPEVVFTVRAVKFFVCDPMVIDFYFVRAHYKGSAACFFS